MEEELRRKVGLLRERIKNSAEKQTAYQELSDLLLQAGKISAAMNILEKSLTAGSHLEIETHREVFEKNLLDNLAGEKIRSNRNPALGKPDMAEGKRLFDRGLEYADAYLFEDAVECMVQSLDYGQDTFETHYCLAGVYKSMDCCREAETHVRKSITLNPRFAPAYILLGALLKNPINLDESVAACKKAVLTDPDCVAAYYDLACYYSLMGKREQSLASIEMALCKGYSDMDWLLQDPDLEALRNTPEFGFLLQSYRQKLG